MFKKLLNIFQANFFNLKYDIRELFYIRQHEKLLPIYRCYRP